MLPTCVQCRVVFLSSRAKERRAEKASSAKDLRVTVLIGAVIFIFGVVVGFLFGIWYDVRNM